MLDGQLESAESKLADAKAAKEEGELSKTTNEGLQRKIQLLEDELDAAERNAKETMEKCVPTSRGTLCLFVTIHFTGCGK